jgi:acylphosphatase
MIVARHYRIVGRVQRVGFRLFVEDAAAREGVGGWVRNCGDGSVEVSAEGDREALSRFERAIRMGPPGAYVERVDVTESQPTGRAPGFSVRF